MKNSTTITTTSKGLEKELKKSSLVYSILYTILVCALGLMLVFNYFAVFTSYFYPTNFQGNSLVGVVNTQNFNKVQKGQLLEVQQYKSTYEIKVGDEIFFAGNVGEGSGIINATFIASGYVKVAINDQTKNVDVSTIIGKVISKTNGWGYIYWFFQSYIATIILNIALVSLIVLRTVFGFTTETSAKGRELKLKLYIQKQDLKKYRRIHKNYIKTGLDLKSVELLDGDYYQNKLAITEYASNNDTSGAYMFLLQKVHKLYVGKHKITVLDRKKISNCIELMCLAENFNIDAEYMLTDLILKTHVVNFDLQNYINSCQSYLSTKHTTEDLECFISILYVLVKRNKHLRKPEIQNFCEDLEIYLLSHKNNKNSAHLLNLTNYIKKLI